MAYPTVFQPPVASGIMPSGALGAQIAAMTRRAVVPVVFVQIYQSHPLLSLFLMNAQMARGGASQITIPTQGASFVSFNWGSFAGDFPMPEDAAAIQNAAFNLKLGMVPLGFFGMEAIIQSSEVIVPKLRAVTSDAAVVIKQALAQSIYQNNYANTSAIDSLVQAYDNGTLSPTYGGITRTGNQWWQGQLIAAPAGLSSRVGQAIMQARVQTGAGGEAPDYGTMNPADWSTLLADYMNLEMYQSTPRSRYDAGDAVNAGFRAIRVLDTPIFPDPWCPRGEMYYFNSRYISAFLSEMAPFVFSGFESTLPQGQIASIGVLITALNLVCSKPSSGAHITGIQGGAWPSTPNQYPAVL